jgi:rubrerythrin
VKVGKIIFGERFDNRHGNYHESKRVTPYIPPKGKTQWPDYTCYNGCGFTTTEDSPVLKCPKCRAMLIRYRNYEVKRGSS